VTMMGTLASKRTIAFGLHLLCRPSLSRASRAIVSSFSTSPIDSIFTILDRSKKNDEASGASPIGSSSSPIGTQNTTTMERLSGRLRQEYSELPELKSSLPPTIEQTRGEIIEVLASELGTNHELILKEAQAYSKVHAGADNADRSQLSAMRLREACTPEYEKVFDNIMAEHSHDGIQFFVQLRQDLLQYIGMHRASASMDERPYLKQLDASLKARLATWFTADMLEVRRITYETTSALVIEKIATKEAVHPMRSLDDLRRRLGPDKRVFCGFHPLLPEEPLCFVHVALRSYIPDSMDQVLEEDSHILSADGYTKSNPTVATFYSISSTQPGLSGVDLGQVLLKKATQLLQEELPSLQTFITLSPLPQFRSWLQDKLLLNQAGGGTFVDSNFLSEDDVNLLQSVFPSSSVEDVTARFLRHLEDPWTLMSNDDIASSLEPLLIKLAVRYIVLEKHRRKPLDGVARFHLANGAEVHRLNYLADTSRKGLHNSLGIMVNYQYKLETVKANRERHAQDWNVPVQDTVTPNL
jgi:malonyl-CoA decarboxylase